MVSHGEDMRLGLLPAPPPVHVDVLSRVDGQRAVGVHGDKKQSGVGVYQVGLVSHVEVVDDRGLVQMGEFRHVVGLVELGRIDLVDGVGVDILLCAIVALDEDASTRQVLDDPSADEGRDGIPKPDIALAGEVVLAFHDATQARSSVVVLGDELRGKGADGRAVAVRVGAQACRVTAAQRRAGEVGEGAVAQVAHGGVVGLVERRGDRVPGKGSAARVAGEGSAIRRGPVRAHGGEWWWCCRGAVVVVSEGVIWA